jgi:hypothetical protein
LKRRFSLFCCLSLLWLVPIIGAAERTDLLTLPDRINPLVIDKAESRLLVYTEVNRPQPNQANPHWGVVWSGGRLKEKAILISFCSPLAFYQALMELGAKPGDNLTLESSGEFVRGSPLTVTVLLPESGRQWPLDRIIEDASGKGFQIRFGGNRKHALEEKTGCITCLESCPVGITSNAAYPAIGSFRRWISPNSKFKGNYDVLPKQPGSPVILIYKLEKS